MNKLTKIWKLRKLAVHGALLTRPGIAKPLAYPLFACGGKEVNILLA
jgi:hypothetical protein